MDTILRQTLLFDFYGDLLTPHQRDIYEEVVCNDISCSEIAQREGVSRQSINELVRKCDKQMDAYEEKLHMMERFLAIRDLVKELRLQADASFEADAVAKGRIMELCDQIMEEL